MNRQLSTKFVGVRDFIEKNKDGIAAALPATGLTADRLIRVALTAIRTNPKLLDCKQESLMAAIMQAAQLGLPTDGPLGFAYLVPYKAECVLIAGYRGLLSLVRRSGEISTIYTAVVRSNDKFHYALGLEPKLTHTPHPDAAGSVTHVYCVAKMKDGGHQFQVWSAAEIDRHKEKYSQAWKNAERGRKDSPWHTNWDEMARKTVIRSMVNRGELPVSVDTLRLAAGEEQWEAKTVEMVQTQPTLPENPVSGLADRLEQSAPAGADGGAAEYYEDVDNSAPVAAKPDVVDAEEPKADGYESPQLPADYAAPEHLTQLAPLFTACKTQKAARELFNLHNSKCQDEMEFEWLAQMRDLTIQKCSKARKQKELI